MKKNRPILTFLLSACCFWSSAFSAEQNGLEFMALCERDRDGLMRDPRASSEGEYRYAFTLILKNVGKTELTVLNNVANHSTLEENGVRLEFSSIFSLSETSLVDINIPSEAELGLVRLRTGEAVEIYSAFRTDQKTEPSTCLVSYRIAPELAKRFGTWEGKIETTALTSSEWSEIFRRNRKNKTK